MGVLFSLLAGLFLGLFQAFNGRARERLEIRKGTVVLLVVSTLIVGGALVAGSGLDELSGVSFYSFALFGIAGLIHFGLGWSLLSVSQRTVGAGRTGVLVGSTPIFAAILGFLILREQLSLLATVGIFLVVAGVVVVSMDRIPEERE